jgi:two-component system, chemotaxis family, chemotaxis protein CheY
MASDMFSSITVLVVEDEKFSQRVVTRLLDVVGVGRAVTADNGDEALKVLETSEHTIDLIISDVEMPEMDGFELTRKIRYGVIPQYKDIPILMLTGHDTDKNVRKGRVHRIDGFVVKPLSQDTLVLHLKQMLDL